MTKEESDKLERTVTFAMLVLRKLRQNPSKVIDGVIYTQLFDSPEMPEQWRNDLIESNEYFVTERIPKISRMLEIKILEYEQELAWKRLAELRGIDG